MTRSDDQKFEDEVRRIAAALWASGDDAGAQKIDGQERDGVYYTDDNIHIVEATVSRRKHKIQDGAQKIRKCKRGLQSHAGHRTIVGWLVTREAPTADQRTALRQQDNIKLLSFSDFQAKLIDARAYLAARTDQPFGSVRDPSSNDIRPQTEFVAPDFFSETGSEIWDIGRIKDKLKSGDLLAILGEYGAGKSMALRHLFMGLREEHLKNKSFKFPVYINLRDHAEQPFPAEILERHGRYLGLDSPRHLVRAWRAGYIYLLLDGFDELSSTLPYGTWRELRQHRYNTMEGVRRLIDESPRGTGICVCGRGHFFNSRVELREALGLPDSTTLLDLGEFTEEQVRRYLQAMGFNGEPPSWIPTRPLLLGYLVCSGILQELVPANEGANDTDPLPTSSPGQCWHSLLDKVAAREAQIEPGITPNAIRKILERLATYARRMESALGPLSEQELQNVFKEVCGFPADQRGLTLLQRLPGLTVTSGNETTRQFVDWEYAAACAAGDVAQYLEDPYGFEEELFPSLEVPLFPLGAEVAAYIVRNSLNQGMLRAAIERAKKWNDKSLILSDLVDVGRQCGLSPDQPVAVKGILFKDVVLEDDEVDLSSVTYRECIFDKLAVPPFVDPSRLPKFDECYILIMEGRTSAEDLPTQRFIKCDIDEFQDAPTTTASIIQGQLPLHLKVALSVLKKLYLQAGSARRESALFRGLDQRSREVVPEVLRVLEQHGLAVKSGGGSAHGNAIWRPKGSAAGRARRIITAPSNCGDLVVQELSE